jgi:hypothetical protein
MSASTTLSSRKNRRRDRVAAVVVPLLCGVSMVAIVAGCGSIVPPRALDEPPAVSKYKGWTIVVTPSRVQELWGARVRVWPPEVHPATHPGISLSFSGTSTNEKPVEEAATAVARQYIDASVWTGRGSSAPPRALDEPPAVSKYKGWTIVVTPSRIQDLWGARVRVWPPEVRPATHPGISLSFSGTSTNEKPVEQAATAVAHQYIDASVWTR